MSKTSTPANIESILNQLVDAGSLGELLSEKEVKAGIINELRDLSVPFPSLVYLLILSAVNGAATFLGDTIKGRLLTFVTKQPKLAILLQKILELQQGEKSKYRIKKSLLGKLNQEKEIDLATLKVDETASLDTLLALHNIQGFQNIIGKLNNNERDLFDHFRTELETLFHSMVEPSLCWPDEVINKDKLGAFDKLKYSAGIDAFHGRDNDIDMLHHFVGDLSMCGERHAFRWMLLTGEGGIGKTRLAYHFTRKVLDESRWKTGKIDFSNIPSQEDMRKWRPRQPTFIVIDYAQNHPEKIGELMRTLSHNAKFFDFPVRLLLLERRADNSWTDKLLPNDGNRAMVLEHCFGREQITGRQLSPLRECDIIALMAARFCRSNMQPPSDVVLLTAARQIDKSRIPRPLFAAAAAEALIAAQYTNSATPVLDRETVLNGIIERERQLRWQKIESVSRPDLRKHEVLLALATYVQGFDLSNLEEIRRFDNHLGRWLPESPPHHISTLISAMGGDEQTLPQLEPDILGEFFLLKQLEMLKGDGASLLAAGVVINQPWPVITLLRILQDFPDLFPHHLLIMILSKTENRQVAEAIAWISPDYVSEVVKRGLNAKLSDFFDALKTARLLFKSETIAFQESKSIFNAIIHASALSNWALVATMLTRFDSLRESLPSNQGFAQDFASAVYNITNQACAEDNWTLADAMLTRLDTLRDAFPANYNIAHNEAMAAFNFANYAGQAGNWELVEAMFARINALQKAFPNYEEFLLQEVKAAVNIIIYAGKKDNQTLVEAMLARINELRKAFPNHKEIAYQEAIAALNITNNASAANKWDQVEKTFVHFDNLRQSLPDYESVVVYEARIVFNILNDAATARNWPLSLAMMVRIDNLRIAFADNIEIALQEAKATFNFTSLACAAGNWQLAETLIIRFNNLRQTFPENQEIALQEAKTSFNLSSHASATGNWPLVEAIQARFDKLRQTFPDHHHIALLEMQAAANITNHACAEGKWVLIEEIQGRLDSLRQSVPIDEELAFNDAKVLANISQFDNHVERAPLVGKILVRIDYLRKSFPENQEIALLKAFCTVNVSHYALDAGNWPLVEKMLNCLDIDRQAFPTNKEIMRQEVRLAIAITYDASRAGRWPLVENMLERLDLLIRVFGPEQIVYDTSEKRVTLLEASNFVRQILTNNRRGNLKE